MSHVTVSGDWRGKGKSVTCNGFWGLEGAREKVSHVTVSWDWREKGNGSCGLEGER